MLKLATRSGGFYHARLANQIELTKVLCNHENRIFTLNFRCKPFWYQENVPEDTITTSGTFITKLGSVYSEPVITVYGSGEITLMVGTTIVELDGIEDAEIANIGSARIDWVNIADLNAAIAKIAVTQLTTASIQQAKIDWVTISELNASIVENGTFTGAFLWQHHQLHLLRNAAG